MNDRIKLAEAMGWTMTKPRKYEWWQGPTELYGDSDCRNHPPDPFTDANDDYAVLEWMRNDPDQPGYRRLGESYLYRVGDYARAALKVIE